MKNEKYDINKDISNILDKTDKQSYNHMIEESFYPPYDDRHLESNVEDIKDGDNFADYCKYIFKLLEEEGYYE